MRPLLFACLAALVLAPIARADEPAASVGQVDLVEKIRNLGYETSDLGRGWNVVQVSRDGTDYPVAFKAEGDWIRFETFLTELPDAENTVSARLSELLAANGRMRPAGFYVDTLEGVRRLIYSRSIPVRGAGAIEIRRGLEAAVGDMAGSKTLWQNVQWTPER